MNLKWKRITFIAIDVIVLGFFGFYLALNLKYDDDSSNGDFALKVLDNNSNTEVKCGEHQYKTTSGTCVCKNGYTSSGGSCVCSKPNTPSGKGCGTISTNGSVPTTCTFDQSDTYEITVTSGSSVISVSNGEIRPLAIKGSTCKVPFSVSIKDVHTCSDGDTAESDTATITGEVMVPWSGGSQGSKCYKYISQATAETNNWSLYTPSCQKDPRCGEGTEWCEIKTRSCGTAPPVPLPHCYDTGYGLLEWALKETVVNNKVQSNMPKGWKIATDANGQEITKDKCYTQFKCSTKYPGADDKETTCNATGGFTGDYVKKCGIKKGDSIGDEFYRIDCKETMKTGFNGPIFDNESSFMYPGTAFKFNYLAKTKVECTGVWHQEFYNAAERYVKNYIDAKKIESFHQEDAGFYGSALNGVHAVRDSYRNWTLNYFGSSMNKETGVIYDVQPSIAGVSKDERKFTLEKSTDSEKVVSSCGSEPNGKNVNFTYKVAYTIKMVLPIVYYSNSQQPEYSTTEAIGYEPLGRVFPISDIKNYANNSDYKYKVEVSNLGLGHKWTDKETCDIKMKEKEIVFRSINLTDPFIQQLDSDHQIGKNWKNEKYDFTGIIDDAIWSKSSQYNKVTINQEVGKLIKDELARQYNSYLGSCAKGTDKGLTPQLCTLYKQAVAGK